MRAPRNSFRHYAPAEMPLDEPEIGIEQVKLIVLMVLWNQGQPTDPMVPAERLASERPGALH